ncbi:hypothetical protein CPT_Muenster_103 [Klebsiella phage Muenster]|nr:hypothetical protein CPT_Muenster_103 [Klebsiella phage Muenster]
MSYIIESSYERDTLMCSEIMRIHERFIGLDSLVWSFREDAYLIFSPGTKNYIQYHLSSQEQKELFFKGSTVPSSIDLSYPLKEDIDLCTEEGYFQGSLILDKKYLTVYTIFQFLDKNCNSAFSIDMVPFLKGFRRKYENS